MQVFGIVALQLAVTVGFSLACLYITPLREYIVRNQWTFWSAWILALVFLLVRCATVRADVRACASWAEQAVPAANVPGMPPQNPGRSLVPASEPGKLRRTARLSCLPGAWLDQGLCAARLALQRAQVLACVPSVRRSYPTNVIMLALFTVVESWLVGTITARRVAGACRLRHCRAVWMVRTCGAGGNAPAIAHAQTPRERGDTAYA